MINWDNHSYNEEKYLTALDKTIAFTMKVANHRL